MSKGERLIVEDSKADQNIFRQIAKIAGFSPVVESTVAGALGRLSADDYHDVWTDTNLGGESSEPVVQAARDKSIPVYVFSAEDGALGQRIAEKYGVPFFAKIKMDVGDLLKIK